jgi:hypothetical protein
LSSSIQGALGLLFAAYVLISLYLGYILKFDFLRSDVLGYWHDSFEWQRHMNVFHAPGYPLTIALARSISFGYVPPLALMMIITFVAFVVSVLLIDNLIRDAGLDASYAALGALLFGLWPFIGLVYVVYPLADLPAIAFFLGGLYALRRSHMLVAALLLGLALIVHKAMWPFVGSLIVAWLSLHSGRHSWRSLAAVLVLLAPLGTIWLLGYIQHGSAIWLLSDSLRIGMLSHSDLPIFDGVFGSILDKGLTGAIKAFILVGLTLLCLILMYSCYRSPIPEARYGFAIALSVFLLCALLKQNEIWAAVRFGKLLALPIIWSIGQRQVARKLPPHLHVSGVALLVLMLFASQLAFAYYMAKVYF